MEVHQTFMSEAPPPRLPTTPSTRSGLFTKAGESQHHTSLRESQHHTSLLSGSGAFGPREAWMVAASERDVGQVAATATHERIHKAAVVDSLRVATRLLDPAMAKSVQSAALSLLQPDTRGMVSREDVARVWLTNVLPALERAPTRTSSGELHTRKLTERLQRLLGGRISQVLLDELPNAQQSLGLMGQPGGGPLPPALVQPLIATLTAAALRATVRELGDALLSLPGLGNDSAGLPTGGDDADDFGSAMGVSQADAVGASEAFVRRMLEGALHAHHAALATNDAAAANSQAAAALDELEEAAVGTPSAGVSAGGSAGSPALSARETLKQREYMAELAKLRDEHSELTSEHTSLFKEREAPYDFTQPQPYRTKPSPPPRPRLAVALATSHHSIAIHSPCPCAHPHAGPRDSARGASADRQRARGAAGGAQLAP